VQKIPENKPKRPQHLENPKVCDLTIFDHIEKKIRAFEHIYASRSVWIVDQNTPLLGMRSELPHSSSIEKKTIELVITTSNF
jgi:hypothetical protein